MSEGDVWKSMEKTYLNLNNLFVIFIEVFENLFQ